MLRVVGRAALIAAVVACADPPPTPVDSSIVEGVIKEFVVALQSYTWDTVRTKFEPGARWIEVNYPLSIDSMITVFGALQPQGIQLHYQLQDFAVGGEGNFAWATWMNRGTFSASSDAGKAILRGFPSSGEHGVIDSTGPEWKFSGLYAESAVLHREGRKWRIVFGHTTPVPPALWKP